MKAVFFKQFFTLAALLACVLSVSCARASGGVKTAPESSDAVENMKEINLLTNKEFSLTNMFPEANITIGFDGNRVFGFSGVNRYLGTYKISGNDIKFTTMGATMMAGPEQAMETESQYLKLLNEVSAYSLDGSTLTLGGLIFERTK